MAIVANALTFQTMLAGVHDVRTLDDLRRGGVLPKAPVLREWERILRINYWPINPALVRQVPARAWERILRINYWPIFHVAREVLAPIPDGTAAGLLARLAGVSSELDAHGVTRSHDLYGRTFQRLISDRKFLATFYTRPESAALLAELAVGLLDADWRDPGALTGLRACDFACGTGTLITAACHALLARHRRAGGDDAAIHRGMLEAGDLRGRHHAGGDASDHLDAVERPPDDPVRADAGAPAAVRPPGRPGRRRRGLQPSARST